MRKVTSLECVQSPLVPSLQGSSVPGLTDMGEANLHPLEPPRLPEDGAEN